MAEDRIADLDAGARENALRSVLRLIRDASDDEQPVFEAIVTRAAELCEAPFAALVLAEADDAVQRLVADVGTAPATVEYYNKGGLPNDPELSFAARAIADARIIHLRDMTDTDEYRAGIRNIVDIARLQGIRTNLFVPLVMDNAGIGCLILFRKEVHPFDDSQIALVQSFADQAVIAIEKVRKFRDVQERLSRERASAEILKVISQSREDEQPVFHAILDNACALCDAPLAGLILGTPADNAQTLAAHKGMFHEAVELFDSGQMLMDANLSYAARSIIEGRMIAFSDMGHSDLYKEGSPIVRSMVDASNIRSVLFVPLMKNGAAIGNITLFRREVRSFDPSEIALVETFAAQAVIAIENVRQFREVQTRLEREQASGEVLELISQSRDDTAPVFDAILERGARLCGSDYAGLALMSEDGTELVYTAHHGPSLGHSEYGKMRWTLDGTSSFAVSINERRPVLIDDLEDTELYRSGDPQRVAHVEKDGLHSFMAVPLIHKGQAIGAFGIARFTVHPFNEDDRVLIEAFAAQAVIAIENVRQFREVQTRLEREAASREILDIISRSQDDDAPVFDAVLRQAATLCGAPMASLNIVDEDRKTGRLVAHWGEDLRLIEVGKTTWDLEFDQDEEFYTEVSMRDGVVRQCHDLKDTDRYRAGNAHRREMVDVEGIRTFLAVPLIRQDQSIGNIALYRREVQPFTDDQITLVETFAAQAVIAIENVRQFREVQTRLERETATKNILRVISQSRDDDVPVFNEILKSASELCRAPLAFLSLANAERTHVIIPAYRGTRSEFGNILDGFEEPITRTELVAVRPVADGQVLRADDITDDDVYRSGDIRRIQMADVEGARSVMSVPLLRDGVSLGAIVLYRRVVSPFSDDDVALVQSFAAQAVIAIENVRQFREVETRLEREAATKDVLQVISQSRDDEMPVFDVILKQAERLCHADTSGLQMVTETGKHLQMMLASGQDRGSFQPGHLFEIPEPLNMCVAARERRVVHGEDLKNDDLYRQGHAGRRALVDDEGVLTQLAVPLIKGDTVIGTMTLSRLRQKPFSPDEIALVETFAAQAVIAIENVRQFREVQERLEREAATSEVLNVISQSRSDAQPVFRTILENAARLCGAPHAMLLLRDADDTHLVLAANNAAQSVFIEQIRDTPHRLDNAESYAVRAVLEQRVIHVPDLREAADASQTVPQIKVALELEGMRTVLQVPLLQGDRAIGVIALYTLEVAPFSDDQIKLVETFAAQAVIAIENTKQLENLETLNAELGDRVEAQVGELERMGKLKRFLPEQVADAVVSSGDDSMLSSHRALISALFCDIRGFTAFCETAEPEETIEVLQAYHEEMGQLIADHGAGVDHRAGDGIMVLFNDPLPCDDPAGDAVSLAFAMRDKMEDLCKRWRKLGHRLGFGVGISLGYATVGMVGSEGRFHYTASGTAVNLASRLCDMAGDGEILLSPRAQIAVEDDVDTERMGEVEIKGISAPVEVWRALGTKG